MLQHEMQKVLQCKRQISYNKMCSTSFWQARMRVGCEALSSPETSGGSRYYMHCEFNIINHRCSWKKLYALKCILNDALQFPCEKWFKFLSEFLPPLRTLPTENSQIFEMSIWHAWQHLFWLRYRNTTAHVQLRTMPASPIHGFTFSLSKAS